VNRKKKLFDHLSNDGFFLSRLSFSPTAACCVVVQLAVAQLGNESVIISNDQLFIIAE
jgi:hypothetical protein